MAHLATRFEASPIGLLETYPGEVYPIDNCSFLGALALHDRLSGDDHQALLSRLLTDLEARYRDGQSSLLYQAVDLRGTPTDRPRGSGTALTAYYLSFADLALSRSLYDSIRDGLLHDTLGFSTVSEYPPGEPGLGDIDSGPVIFGQGVSATGFTLSLARIHGERETFTHIYATAALFGGPVEADGTHYALGGPIGDALMFALTTAQPTTSTNLQLGTEPTTAENP